MYPSGFYFPFLWMVRGCREREGEGQMSHEKNLGWLFDIGDYTTQVYGDWNNHHKDPY